MKWIRILALFVLAQTAQAQPQYALAMRGTPALPADFTSLPYANPDAPKGGTLKQAVTGTFDSLNSFIVAGNPVWITRTYVYESMMARNWAEPFTVYGLLAESIDVNEDRSQFTFKLRPEAKFSDGSPVTSDDVKFSLETLHDHGRPNYKSQLSKITRIETPDLRTITLTQNAGDRELPLIVGLMPILSKAYWAKRDFEATTMEPPVSSGPYVVADVKPGEGVTLRKNPNYWGQNLPINKGLWNFDTLRFDYIKDANIAFEAFKTGNIDLRQETDPVKWQQAYDFPAAKAGRIIRETYTPHTPAPAQGLVFNTRRKIFADVRVREALVNAFDAEWANANLFGGLNKRIYGYYSGSSLSSFGKPADATERVVLGDAAKTMRPDFLDGSYRLPVTDASGHDRKSLRRAVDLLAEAGWKMSDKGLVNGSGEPFTFTITIQNADMEKLALHYQRSLALIGVKADVRKVDDTTMKLMQTGYDFDMMPFTYYNSLSPGGEQVLYFGSLGRTQKGSRNYMGVADPAVDRAIEAMLKAKTPEEFAAAVSAEDRLLASGFYAVPLFTQDQWFARAAHVGSNPPDKQPLTGFEATTLWETRQ